MSFMSRRIAALLLLAGLVAAGGEAGAHVPESCRPLFVAAGKASESLTRKGQEASDIALAGLDRIRRIDGDDYRLLADRLAQLFGAQTEVLSEFGPDPRARPSCGSASRSPTLGPPGAGRTRRAP